MLPPREEQGHPPALPGGQNRTGKHTRPLSRFLSRIRPTPEQGQHPDLEVSSLYSTSPWAAWPINSCRAAWMVAAVSATISHWVAAGAGSPGFPPALPADSREIHCHSGAARSYWRPAASYFSVPTPSGASAVNTSPQRLHLSFSNSYTVAAIGACPWIRTSRPGSRNG